MGSRGDDTRTRSVGTGGTRTNLPTTTATWDTIASETDRYSNSHREGPVKTVPHYFFIDKAGPISKLRRALVYAKLGGDFRMVRAYNLYGREAG